MSESKKGMSAAQTERMLGITNKTAWYLNHRIRHAVSQAERGLLSNIVEVDETWVGGRKRGRPAHRKTIVIGIIERGGDAVLEVINERDRRTLYKFVLSNVDVNVQGIYTDSWAAYRGLPHHDAVNHSAWEWARGDVHTNHIENVWSLLKRSIMGSFHHVSRKYLHLYLSELQWRLNNRTPYLTLMTLRQLMRASPLPYKELVG